MRRADYPVEDIVGMTVNSLNRRGKYLDFVLEKGRHLLMHMGMSGRLFQMEEENAADEPHMHLVIHLDNNYKLVYQDARRFGGVWLIYDAGSFFEKLGVEPLSSAFNAAYLERVIRNRKVPIKSLILDQRLIAGVGNIYADEALHEAHISPERSAGSLHKQEIARLVKALKKVLGLGIQQRGTTLRDYRDGNNQSGGFQDYLKVYGRHQQPCSGCGQILQRTRIGGRSSHYCPHCQK